MAEGVQVCDGVLQDVGIDGYEKGIVQKGVDTVVGPRDTKPREIMVGSVCALGSDGGVEM